MSSPRPSRLLALAAAAACVITLAACGAKAAPNVDPTSTSDGQIGDVTSTPTDDVTTTTSAPTTATSTSNNNPPASPYPGNAKDYGFEILKAIAQNNDARIVDLGGLNTAQYVNTQNYKSKNGSWTFTDCTSGSTQMCSYYNVPGNIATVGVESGKLGKKEAVNSVYIEGDAFATEAGGYVTDFVMAWINGSYVRQKAFANDTVINFVKNKTKPQGGFVTQPQPCGSNRLCVDAGEYLAGGQPAGQIIHFVVDQGKLGKANAIVSASA